MILTCPSCGTQYVVKDGAIPPQGRQVRCAACKHSWHQEPDDQPVEEAAPPVEEETVVAEETSYAEASFEEPAVEEPAEERGAPDYGTVEESDVAADAGDEDEEDESLAEATLIEPRSGPDAEQRAYEEAMVEEAPAAEIVPDEPAQAAGDEDFSPFAFEEEEERRRSPLLTVLLIVLLVIAVAAAFWFLAPNEWKSRVGLAASGTSPLQLVTTHMDRQRLESGNELLTVTGRVINPTGDEQPVPPLQAQLKSKAGQVVYRWTIAPPASTLAPGASAPFNSAEVNVPPGGEEITLTLGTAKS